MLVKRSLVNSSAVEWHRTVEVGSRRPTSQFSSTFC